MSADTIHGVALNIAGNGLLILGPSGSGKTSLALDLIDHCQARGIEARLVADDRVIMRNSDGSWFASAPESLKGLIEVRGSGIHKINFLIETQVHLAINLVPESSVLRLPDKGPQKIGLNIFLPCLTLPQKDYAALRAILAHLGLYAGVNSLRQPN